MLASKDELADSSELFALSQVSALASVNYLYSVTFYQLLKCLVGINQGSINSRMQHKLN